MPEDLSRAILVLLPVHLSAWVSRGPVRLCRTDRQLAHTPGHTALPQSCADWEDILETTRRVTMIFVGPGNMICVMIQPEKGGGWESSLPFKIHSFSQAGSWTGGGVMNITLSADTPAEARSLAISFRFSEYSCTGTCCWGFLSARQKEIKGWFHKETLEWWSFQEQRWKGYSANSKWLLLTSMGQGCQWNRIRDKERGMSLGGTFKCTVVCPKEDGDSSYVVCWVLTADDAREDYLGPSRIIPRQSSVYNVTLSEGKIDVRIMNRDVTPAQFSVDTKVWILLW